MRKDEVGKLFENIGVMNKGHFRLSSGLHSDTYLQCAILQQFPELNDQICNVLAEQVREFRPTLIVGAAVGGIISCYELAKQLKARCIFAERVDGKLTFRRTFKANPDDRIVIIEDVVTTGKTTKEMIALLDETNNSPLALCTIVDRSEGKHGFSYPLFSAYEVKAHVWEPDKCPLCEAGMEVNQPGSRKIHS